MRADLHRHPSGHLAHRRQQRQRAGAIGHRLISDAGGARLHQPLGLFGVGSKVQIGEQHLSAAQAGDLLRLRLLHLHDHLGGEHIDRDLRPRGAIGVVGKADSCAGTRLDQHRVTMGHEFPHTSRGQAHAVFVGLDLLGDADAHGSAPVAAVTKIGMQGAPDKVESGELPLTSTPVRYRLRVSFRKETKCR